jgi:hypothetical protein
MCRRLTRILSGLAALVVFAPKPALALDFLWETQGSYVHQMAHLTFALAMMYFIFEIKRGELRGMPGVKSLIWACGLLVWWNLDAIFGHAVDWSLHNPVILGTGLDSRLVMEDWQYWAYYVTKITHFLLLIPAFYLFYRCLQRFSRESERFGGDSETRGS